MKTKAQGLFMALALAALVIAAGAPAFAAEKKDGPGPVVLTFMERVESQTAASASNANTAGILPQNRVSGETFLYSMVSGFRKLNKDTTGNIYYLNKYSIDDEANASHVYGLSIGRTLTNKWKADASYSHSSNPRRNTVASSDSDRFSFGFTYKLNPNEKARKRYTFKTTYSTGSDFSQGRTLSQKIGVDDDLTKKWSYSLDYTFVWGLNENPPSTYKEHYTNQYQADFTFKIDKKQRITLGYLYLDQLFNGAKVTGDNALTRFSYFYSYY